MDAVVGRVMEHVKEKQKNEGSGHDWWHTLRVYHNALDIAKHCDGQMINMRVIQLGALLHDIADHKFGYDDGDRNAIITEILRANNVEIEEIHAVVDIANTISFKNGTNLEKLKRIEAQIVQDADRLDAIGAIGIARTFTYGGFMKRQIYNPDILSDSRSTIQHFYEKLLVLKDEMNTIYGRQKAEERHQFTVMYLEQFYAEWEGER